MKKKSLRSILILTVLIAVGIVSDLRAQNSIQNLYGALSRVDTDYTSFTFDPNGTTIQDTEPGYHINGVAYKSGYYYIARSRPESSNNQKLLIVSESGQEVVKKMTLETGSSHPGGIQIYDNILVVPFQMDDGSACKICFYNLDNPSSPTLVGSYISTGVANGYCAGITEYNGYYLVAHYYARQGYIRFYHFDSSFNKIKEKTWRAPNQDKSGWYPLSDWSGEQYNYESINLLKTSSGYFMILYHNTDAADVFEIDDVSLNSVPEINMVYRLNFNPYKSGFRYAGGFTITNSNNLRFFSTCNHVFSSTSENVISSFKPDTDWPWKLGYHIGNGGQMDVGINDSDNCVEMHLGSPGSANEEKLYASVGEINSNTNEVEWGSPANSGVTGTSVTIALANNNYCVEAHQGPSGSESNKHYYRVGQINPSAKTISWGESTYLQTGGQIAIATDNSNHVVEVHRGSAGGANENRHYYRVGTINTSNKTISWGASSNFNTGGEIDIAVNNNGYCVEVHRGSPGGSTENNLYYRVGNINFSTKTISWGASAQCGTGGDIDVSFSNDNRVLEVHRGSSSSTQYNHYYRFGTVDTGSKTISWGASTKYDGGGHLVVAKNNYDDAIEMHLGAESGSNSNVIFCRTIECGNNSNLKSQSLTTSVEGIIQKGNDDHLIMYPNPVSQELNIQFEVQQSGNVEMDLIDISGRRVLQKNLGVYPKGGAVLESITLPDNMNEGIYILHLKEDGKPVATRKVMVI